MYSKFQIHCIIYASEIKKFNLIFKYIINNGDLIDKITIMSNSSDKYLASDLFFLECKYPKLVNIVDVTKKEIPKYISRNFNDKNTIYIYATDDVCFVDNNALAHLVQSRIKYPNASVVYPCVINTNRTAYLHQVMGLLPANTIIPWTPEYIDNYDLTLCKKKTFRSAILKDFLNTISANEINKLNFGEWTLSKIETIPTEGACWFGKSMIETGFQDIQSLFSAIRKETEGEMIIFGNSIWATMDGNTDKTMLAKFQSIAIYNENLSISKRIAYSK